jgi:hypothetical protein
MIAPWMPAMQLNMRAKDRTANALSSRILNSLLSFLISLSMASEWAFGWQRQSIGRVSTMPDPPKININKIIVNDSAPNN